MITLVKVKSSFYQLCRQYGVDRELLYNERGRPCVLLVKLRYKNDLRDFVVPLRSNISSTTPSIQYFPLPPNPSTKRYRRHGLHYIKIFPVDRKYLDVYQVSGDNYYINILRILNMFEKNIVNACQDYLNDCEKGNKHLMTPDIDGILNMLDRIHSCGK